ncbi:MAG: helix-turn-helix domain-containing protein [Ruminococcus sp.]
MLKFGERLKRARERAGLTQSDVQRSIGLGFRSLSRYENNTAAPDPETIAELVRLYDVSVDFVLGFSDEMGHAPHGSSLAPPAFLTEEAAEALAALSPESREKVGEYINLLSLAERSEGGD